MKRKNIVIVIAVAVLLGALIVYLRWQPTTERTADIKVGAVLSLTGPLAFLGKPEQDALIMAAEEVNATGGINGKQVKILVEDSKSSARDGVSALQKVLLDSPVAVITGQTLISNATQPILTSAKTPQVVLGVHPSLAKQSEFTVRPYYGYEDEMKVLADYVVKHGQKRIGVMWVMVPDAEASINQVLAPELQRLGGSIVVSESYNLGETNLRPQLTKVAAANPDAIFVMDFGNMMPTILKDAATLGVREKIITDLGMLSAPPIDAALTEGMPVVGPAFVIRNASSFQQFSAKFKQRTGAEPNYDVLYTYDAIKLLFLAIQEAGTDPVKLAKALRTERTFEGVTGKMYVHSDGNVTVEMELAKFVNGRLVPLKGE
jgi:branched-chain amino acid transport system substrate-binding protein